MLKSFIGWLDDHLADTGLIGLLGGLLGILAFGATLSAVLGPIGIKSAAVVAAALGTVGLLSMLLAERANSTKRLNLAQHLLARYCDQLMTESHTYYQVRAWRQVLIIESTGDTKSLICLRAVSEKEGLSFFRFRVGANGDQPAKYLKKVQVQVASLKIGGIGGARCDQTVLWLEDQRLEVLVHFTTPVALGNEFTIVFEVDWPGKCRSLVVGREPVDFTVRVDHGLEHLEYVIVLPPGEDACYDPVGFGVTDQRFRLSSQSTNGGCLEVTLSGSRIPPMPKVGVRMDLKKRKARSRRSGHLSVLPIGERYLSALTSSPPPPPST